MSLNDNLRNLTRSSLHEFMEPEALKLLAFSAEAVHLKKRDILFESGKLSDGGYIVVSGSLELIDVNGIQIHRPQLGAMIGLTSLIAETENGSTARAINDVEILKISRPLFLRVLAEFPKSAARMQEILQRKLTNYIDALQTTSLD